MSSTWRELDHSSVSPTEAIREWALHGHDILEEIAPRFGRTIAREDLAHEVQRRSGILTDRPEESWLGTVLGAIAERCRESGEPELTSLVADPPVQVDATRLRCHQAYGAKIPNPDGGRTRSRSTSSTGRRAASASSRSTTSPRSTTTRAKSSEPRRRPVCPSCFMEIPSTGVCDNCG